jgi:hypothetical protein
MHTTKKEDAKKEEKSHYNVAVLATASQPKFFKSNASNKETTHKHKYRHRPIVDLGFSTLKIFLALKSMPS